MVSETEAYISIQKQKKKLLLEMEELRNEIHNALDAACGDQHQAHYQQVSRLFDEVMNRYMQLMTSKTKN